MLQNLIQVEGKSRVAGNIPADDIRVHPCAADLFANLIDDEQINLIQWQAWHQRSGSVQQITLFTGKNLASDHFDLGGLMVLILNDGDAAEYPDSVAELAFEEIRGSPSRVPHVSCSTVRIKQRLPACQIRIVSIFSGCRCCELARESRYAV